MKPSPKQRPIADLQREAVYIVKRGDLYANGARRWVARQRSAFRFDDRYFDARTFARDHADTFRDKSVRVVRLVPKVKP